MTFNEFDGSFLQSLSIDDTNFATPDTHHQETGDDDDYMDIDKTFDLDPPTLYHTPPSHQGDFHQRDTDRLTPIKKLQSFLTSPFQSTPIDRNLGRNRNSKPNVPKDIHLQKKEDVNDSLSRDEVMYDCEMDHSDTDESEEIEEIENSQLEADESNRSESVVSSFSHTILSPTTLGARLAVQPRQKLLLPANSDGDESVDYEVDRSSNDESYSTNSDTFVKYRGTPELEYRPKQRMISSFSSADANTFFANARRKRNGIDEYTFNPTNGNYDDSYNNINGSTLNQSYLYRKQNKFPSVHNNLFSPMNNSWATPLQVHHHHYYSTPVNQSMNQMRTPNHLEMMQSHPSHNQSPSRLDVQIREHDQQVQLARKDINLPLPWEPNSCPHEKTSYMLSSYLQLLVNLIATCYATYLTYSIIQTIRQDIKHKLSQQISNTLIEIESCKRSYQENNCDPELIVPILEKPCAYWLQCMNQDPFNGGGNKSLISAETVGMIINSLIEPLSFKFFLVMFGFILLIFACNFTFGFIRAKSYYGWKKSLSDDVKQTEVQ